MSARTARILATALAAVFLIAADAPETRLEQYQRLRREGVAAAQAGDLAKAEDALRQALDLYPDVPGSYIRLARVQAAAGNTDEALRNVQLYAGMGLKLDLTRDPALKRLTELPDYPGIARILEDNALPFGDVTPIATLDGVPEFIGESVVHDGKGWLLGTVSGRAIVRLDGDKASPFLETDPRTGAIFGMAVDPKRGVLWAAEAWGEELPGGTGASRTGLLKVSLADGRVLSRVAPPDDGAKHQFGDVVLAADGTAYATDSVGGGVWRLKAGGARLEPLVAPGAMSSPQGMAICPGGKALLVADYSTGLHRVDLSSGEIVPVEGLMAGLAGTDGLIAATGVVFGKRNARPQPFAVVATQNGVSPQRVLLLRIRSDCREVEDSVLVAANLPGLDDLTLATMHDGGVVFVGHARWAERGEDLKLTTPTPPPIRVFRAVLPRTSD